MGIMAGLNMANDDYGISTDVDISQWKWLLAVDLFYLNFLKEARFTRSNDLLYVYCTEYNLTDVVGQMHPNSATFSSFKLRMNEYLRKFYNNCVELRLMEMFNFYKAALLKIKDSRTGGFYGSKMLEDTLVAVYKADDNEQIFNRIDDVYLTLKNYNKLQFNQTPEMLSNEVVEGFISKLETTLLVKNEGLDDDQYRRKLCRVVEIANLFLSYAHSYMNIEKIKHKMRWGYFDNRALVSYDQMWKYMTRESGIAPMVQKGLPYKHVDIDAAVCLFPETTDYRLLKEEFTKQNRPANQTSEHLINDWLMHWFLVSKLRIRKKQDDRWAKEYEMEEQPTP